MANASPAHTTVVTIAIEVIGITIMAIIAETGPKMGRMMVTLMGGIMLMWFVINAKYFASIVGKAGKYS